MVLDTCAVLVGTEAGVSPSQVPLSSANDADSPATASDATQLATAASAEATPAPTAEDAELHSPNSHSPESAQKLRDKYNRLFEMAESAPEGPAAEAAHEHSMIDSFVMSHGHESSGQPTAGQPQAMTSAQGTGTQSRGDAHLSLKEMLLLQEDSLAESKATPLLQHRVSMASNIADFFPTSPPSSASPLHSERSTVGSPDHHRTADSASSRQQAETSQQGGWPGPAPEWISIVMRGKHKDREAFIQFHVPEELVYVNSTNLTLKVNMLGHLNWSASCQSAPVTASLQMPGMPTLTTWHHAVLLHTTPLIALHAFAERNGSLKKKQKHFTGFCQPTRPITCANHGNHVQHFMKSRQSTTRWKTPV